MKIPSKVKIGGMDYKVNITDNITMGYDYSGEILYASQKINIRPMNIDAMNKLFLHEVVHGMLYELGYIEHDEKKVTEMANQIYRLIKDNPKMFKED